MGPSGHLEPSTTDKRTKITNETNLHKMNILILMLVFSVYSVNSFSTHRTKRAVYTIIPQLRDSSQELVDVGSPCPCEDGGSDCFLDTRLICRPEVRLTGSDTELSTVNKVEEIEDHSRKHVKRKLANLLMKWIQMRDAEMRLIQELQK